MTIRFRCEHCGHAIEAPETSAGQRSFCPKCGGALTIPLLTEQSSEPPVLDVEATQYRPPLDDIEATQYRPPGAGVSRSPFDGQPTRGAASQDPYQTPRTEPGAPYAYSTSSAGSSNSMAVVALVFALLSITIGCCCWLHVPLSIAAIVMGVFGLQNSKKAGGAGRGMAITAIVIGAIAFVFYTALAVLGLALQLQGFGE